MLIKKLISCSLVPFFFSVGTRLGSTSEGVKQRLGEVEISNAGWDGSRTGVLLEASYAHCTTVGSKQLPLYKQSILRGVFQELYLRCGKWRQTLDPLQAFHTTIAKVLLVLYHCV